MDTTDTALGYSGVAVLAIGMLCCVYSVIHVSCKHKKDVLLNNGDDSVSEV